MQPVTTLYRSTRSLDSLFESNQIQVHYISRVSQVVETLADTILTGKAMPSVPSVDHFCRGIQIAVNDQRRLFTSDRLSLPPQLSWKVDRNSGAFNATLVEPSMMDRMIVSTVSGADNREAMVRVWPALPHGSLTSSQQIKFLCSNKSPSGDEIHLLPILSHGRWTLFRIDPLRGIIDFLDFFVSGRGCEMSTFQASLRS